MTSPLMSVDDVAAFTGLSAYTIRQAVREGDLPGVKIRGRVRVDPDDLLAWVERSRIEPARAADGARPSAPAPAPRRRPPPGGYRAAAKQRRSAA